MRSMAKQFGLRSAITKRRTRPAAGRTCSGAGRKILGLWASCMPRMVILTHGMRAVWQAARAEIVAINPLCELHAVDDEAAVVAALTAADERPNLRLRWG